MQPVAVCAKCHVKMQPNHNGTKFIECKDMGEPFKIWNSDKYICPACGIEILVDFAERPLSVAYDGYFEQRLQQARKDVCIEEGRLVAR